MSKKLFVEIIVTSILASIGTNLITEIEMFDRSVDICMGIIIIAIVIIISFKQSFGGILEIRKYTGFFVYDRTKENIVDIHRYDFSWNMSTFINAAISESEDLKMIYQKAKKSWSIANTDECRMVKELLEYYLLDKLKTHTLDYFNIGNFKPERIKEISRNDIPDIVIENDFLNLFSKMREERAKFDKKEDDELDNLKYRIISSFSGSGALYDEFKLILPVESKIFRNKEGKIEIKTKKFTVIFDFKLRETRGQVICPN